MSRATLTAGELPGGRLWVVDCEHGTTHAAYQAGTGPDAVHLTDVQVARLAVAKHYGVEGCRCTRHLRRRYGVTP